MKSLDVYLGYRGLRKPIKFTNLASVNLPKLEHFTYEYDANYKKKNSVADEIETHKLFPAIIRTTSVQLKYLRCRLFALKRGNFYHHLEFAPIWTALEKIILVIGLTDSFLSSLSESSLKPRDLHLDIHNCGTNFTIEKLTEFLTSQSKNLVNLEIFERSWRYSIKFPRMEALQTIRFNDAYNLSSREYICFEQFDYATHLPAISEVKLSTHSNEEDWLAFFSSKSSSMKSMRLPIMIFTNLNLARSLPSLFPNLMELCVGLGQCSKYQNVLGVIFAAMSNLKSLKIYGFVSVPDVPILIFWPDLQKIIVTGLDENDGFCIQKKLLMCREDLHWKI